MNDHLTVTTSDRGFDRLPPIPSAYGGEVRVYESSAAMGPHIWLAAADPANPNGNRELFTVHLTAENAWKLADQLRHLVEHHYQGDARPDGSSE